MKIKRQSKIIELIKNYDIETQDELVSRLHKAGYKGTQSTVSRDIRELKLTKIQGKNGQKKYVILGELQDNYMPDRFVNLLKDAITSIDYAQSIVVIKTLEGMAMAVAAAIDAMHNPAIIGTIAGDDAIFCAIKTKQLALRFIEELNDIVKS